MSEKRFTIEESENQLIIFDNGVSDETYFHLGNDERDVKYVCDLLNEQQELIEELHISDHMGWGRAERFEKELKQKKIYIKRLEYKVQKFKEMNNEQQSTIQSLKEEKDFLVAVIDENLLKGYHEQSIKHKEAKDKMKEGESSEVSPILDVIFYWTGYIKALEELKEGVSDE